MRCRLAAAALGRCFRLLSQLSTLPCCIDISVPARRCGALWASCWLFLVMDVATIDEQGGAGAAKRAASAALASLRQALTHAEAVADCAVKRELFRSASVARDQAAVASTSSDLQACKDQVFSTKADLAEAAYDASRGVLASPPHLPPSPPSPRLEGKGRGEAGAEARRVPKPPLPTPGTGFVDKDGWCDGSEGIRRCHAQVSPRREGSTLV